MRRSDLETLVKLTQNRNRHLIVDEVASTALFSSSCFVSAANYVNDYSHVHVVASLSKIGLAGIGIGAVYSSLPLKPIYAQVSSLTQAIMVNAMDGSLLKVSRQRLTCAYEIVCDLLKQEKIPFLSTSAGLTVMINLSSLCHTFDDEQGLSYRLVHQAKVYLQPGQVFHYPNPGWFRLTFSDHEDVIFISDL